MIIKILSFILVPLVLIVFNGCIASQPLYYGSYNISMTEVERPLEAKERYGEQKITSVTEEGNLKYYFEDDLVKVAWIATSSSLSFFMENKTDHSIKIIWDEAVFVDDKDVSHRVMHSGVEIDNRNTSQPPTVIVRKGRIEDFVFPTDYIYYGYYGWNQKQFFESRQSGGEPTELENNMRNNIGKTFQVLLPLEIENVVNDYIFKFKVDSYEYKGEFER